MEPCPGVPVVDINEAIYNPDQVNNTGDW